MAHSSDGFHSPSRIGFKAVLGKAVCDWEPWPLTGGEKHLKMEDFGECWEMGE